MDSVSRDIEIHGFRDIGIKGICWGWDSLGVKIQEFRDIGIEECRA